MRLRIRKPMTVGWCEVRGLGPGGLLRGPGVCIQSADMSILISMRPVEGHTDWITSAQDGRSQSRRIWLYLVGNEVRSVAEAISV